MTAGHELQQLIDLLQASDDPVAQLKNWVLASGGVWVGDGHDGVFDLQYLGIVGLGVGAADAVRDWISAATLKFQVDTAV